MIILCINQMKASGVVGLEETAAFCSKASYCYKNREGFDTVTSWEALETNTDTTRLNKFRVTPFQSCEKFNSVKNYEIALLKCAPNFSLRVWESSETKVAKQHCWVDNTGNGAAMLQPIRLHCVGSLDFNWTASYSLYVVDHMSAEFRFAKNSTCAGPSAS